MKVVVVGAGIAGLCTAAGLASTGADVTVIEKAPEVRGGGAGLSIFANGVRALESLGLGSVFGDAVAPTQLTSGTRTPDGRWLSRFDPASLVDMRVVRRTDLHAGLLAAVTDDVEIRTGSGVDDISPGSGLVRLADGTEFGDCDLIVGADGLRSRVRPAIVADPGVRQCGYSAWRAVTSTPVRVDAAGETTGRGARFGIAPLPDGHVYWFASVSTTGDGADGGLDEVRQRFSGWHRPIGELLEATDPADVGYLPIEGLAASLPTFVGSRCVLVGDAAHAMTPNLGQGANQAMEDAATLVALLRRSGPGGLDDTLRVYDELRRPRTQRIARQASMVGRVGQMRAGPAVRARDLALRMTPDAVLNAQMRRVQRWEPPEV